MWRNVGFLPKLAKIGFFILSRQSNNLYLHRGHDFTLFLLRTDWFLAIQPQLLKLALLQYVPDMYTSCSKIVLSHQVSSKFSLFWAEFQPPWCWKCKNGFVAFKRCYSSFSFSTSGTIFHPTGGKNPISFFKVCP